MRLNLHDLCDAVGDEESFVAFADVLRGELLARRCDLPAEGLLAAAVAWARAHPAALDDAHHAAGGSAAAPPPANPWQRAARILLAGFVDSINET